MTVRRRGFALNEATPQEASARGHQQNPAAPVTQNGHRTSDHGGDLRLRNATRTGRRSRPSAIPTPVAATSTPTPSLGATPTPQPAATTSSPTSETISGVLTEARTEIPVPNSCVGWRSTSAADTDGSNYAAVDKDGRWSIPVNPESIFFLFFYATSGGNCEGPVDSSSYLPSWYANLPFDFETPKDARAPKDRTLTKVNSGDTGVAACLGTTSCRVALTPAPKRVRRCPAASRSRSDAYRQSLRLRLRRQ